MTRSKVGVVRRRRHKKMLTMTKGHQGVRHRLYRRSHESMLHAYQYAYDHRRAKKGDMRRIWNVRINAAARSNGISYSKLINGLSIADVTINRKMLAEIAIDDPEAFSMVVDTAKAALDKAS